MRQRNAGFGLGRRGLIQGAAGIGASVLISDKASAASAAIGM